MRLRALGRGASMNDNTNTLGEYWTDERCYITELMNSAEIPDVSLALARVEPGVRTQLHALQGVEEIYIVRAGVGQMEIDGSERHLTVGDRAIVPRSAAQRITNVGDTDLEFYCLCRPRFQPECYVNLEDGSN